MNLTLVLADQLFQTHPALDTDTDFVMIESLSECRRLPYHSYKLTYLLTCMREYADYLRDLGKTVYYFKLDQEYDFDQALAKCVKNKKYVSIQLCEVNNKYFSAYVEDIVSKLHLNLTWLQSPMFLTSKSEFASYIQNKTQKRNLMGDFYIWQRKRLNILVDQDSKPIGQKWSFDEQNRQKLPSKIELPQENFNYSSPHYDDVSQLVQRYFPNNPGQLPKLSWLPLNHFQARSHLKRFIQERLQEFGPYEDALSSRGHVLFHSALSSCLNYGLLTPSEVLDELNQFTNGLILGEREARSGETLNSLEGFIRQIIGWREWIKGMYDNFYDQKSLELNFFEARVDLPDWFYSYNLPIDIEANTPLRIALQNVDRFAYAHHIERLMVLSNWMLLNRYEPSQCYQWFASQFVDAFEWVMIPNVIGMGLFADGGIFATKPYLSGGNYIRKMSDYADSKNWESIWTDKFWDFLETHRSYFETQPRLNMLLKSRKK